MSEIVGTPDNDSLTGTDKGDVISSLKRDDYLVAQGGQDSIEGGAGNDAVQGPVLEMPFPRAKSRRQVPLGLRRRLAALAEGEPSIAVA